MRVKSIASLLICGVTLLAVSPSSTLAQTAGQPADVRGEQSAGVERARPAAELKEVFAAEVEKKRAGAISRDDIRRLEKGWLAPQSGPTSSGFSKKTVVLVIVFLVVITGLAIVLAHNGVDPGVRCEDDPLAPNCVP